MMQMRALEPLPATRFNFNQALTHAGELGGQIAVMTTSRTPFNGLETLGVVCTSYLIWDLVVPRSVTSG